MPFLHTENKAEKMTFSIKGEFAMLKSLSPREYGWIVFLFFLIFFQPWLVSISSRERRLVEAILKRGEIEPNGNDPFDVKPLIDEINQNSTLFFQITRSNRFKFRGNLYVFFDGIVVFTSSSWRGAHSAKEPVRCLISTDRKAKEELSSSPQLFRKLAETDDVAVFYIRRLSEFVKEIQG